MTFKCQHCTATIDLDNASPRFTYICRKHFDATANPDPSVRFDQRWEKDFYWLPTGFQFITPEEVVSVPEWAKTDEGIRQVIETAFPRWRTSEQQHFRAARWARMIYLAYRAQFTLGQIADEMRMTLTLCEGCGFKCNTHRFMASHDIAACFCYGSHLKEIPDAALVENIWRRVQRVAANMRADGTGRRIRQRHDQFRTT